MSYCAIGAAYLFGYLGGGVSLSREFCHAATGFGAASCVGGLGIACPIAEGFSVLLDGLGGNAKLVGHLQFAESLTGELCDLEPALMAALPTAFDGNLDGEGCYGLVFLVSLPGSFG